ncbi:alcohol dehydrogenase [bacterium]|nr:MAG: alcohol dehydrogenase [bacterium]
MKVAVYYRNDDVRIEDHPEPVLSKGEILVKMMASGICGTDVMQWYRIKKAPRILGHEMSGEVVKVGEGVEKFKQGDRVFVSHHVPCFHCHRCTQGHYTACESLHGGNYIPGGFSEFIKVPEENVKYGTFFLPENVTFEDATMIEPLGCVVAGQKQIGFLSSARTGGNGKTLLIVGSGISGLLHIQLAKLSGAYVIATDINDYRLSKALEYGADHAINAKEFSVEKLLDLNKNNLADIAIVCAGAEQAVRDAILSIDRKGTILFFAVPDTDIILPSPGSWRNEISVSFSYGAAPQDLEEALKLISRGDVDVRSMITHTVPLANIQQGFQLVAEARESLKVVVVPGNTI